MALENLHGIEFLIYVIEHPASINLRRVQNKVKTEAYALSQTDEGPDFFKKIGLPIAGLTTDQQFGDAFTSFVKSQQLGGTRVTVAPVVPAPTRTLSPVRRPFAYTQPLNMDFDGDEFIMQTPQRRAPSPVRQPAYTITQPGTYRMAEVIPPEAFTQDPYLRLLVDLNAALVRNGMQMIQLGNVNDDPYPQLTGEQVTAHLTVANPIIAQNTIDNPTWYALLTDQQKKNLLRKLVFAGHATPPVATLRPTRQLSPVRQPATPARNTYIDLLNNINTALQLARKQQRVLVDDTLTDPYPQMGIVDINSHFAFIDPAIKNKILAYPGFNDLSLQQKRNLLKKLADAGLIGVPITYAPATTLRPIRQPSPVRPTVQPRQPSPVRLETLPAIDYPTLISTINQENRRNNDPQMSSGDFYTDPYPQLDEGGVLDVLRGLRRLPGAFNSELFHKRGWDKLTNQQRRNLLKKMVDAGFVSQALVDQAIRGEDIPILLNFPDPRRVPLPVQTTIRQPLPVRQPPAPITTRIPSPTRQAIRGDFNYIGKLNDINQGIIDENIRRGKGYKLLSIDDLGTDPYPNVSADQAFRAFDNITLVLPSAVFRFTMSPEIRTLSEQQRKNLLKKLIDAGHYPKHVADRTLGLAAVGQLPGAPRLPSPARPTTTTQYYTPTEGLGYLDLIGWSIGQNELNQIEFGLTGDTLADPRIQAAMNKKIDFGKPLILYMQNFADEEDAPVELELPAIVSPLEIIGAIANYYKEEAVALDVPLYQLLQDSTQFAGLTPFEDGYSVVLE